MDYQIDRNMRDLYRYILALFLSCFCLTAFSSFEAGAQVNKLVTGTLINESDNKALDGRSVSVMAYGFDREALAKDFVDIYKSGSRETITFAKEMSPPDAYGSYSTYLPEDGAMVFIVDVLEPIIVNIRGRAEIDIMVPMGGTVLDNSLITASGNVITPISTAPKINGNILTATTQCPVPAGIVLGDNYRLILQPYFKDVEAGKVELLEPMVFEGEQYASTQLRRMSYNMKNDRLTDYVCGILKPIGTVVEWSDSIYIENPNKPYCVDGRIIIEDYNAIVYQDTIELASARMRRPMQFLDYEVDSYELNPDDYYENPKPKQMESEGAMSLNFLVNQAAIDMRDTVSWNSLNKAKKTILDIVNGSNSQLRMFEIECISSPEGDYKKNEDLAKRRLNFASDYIMKDIPQSVKDRLSRPDNKAIVAPWSAVADSLAADSLIVEASEIRAIISRFNKHDTQGPEIKRLPYYREKVVPVLDKMRSVKYTFKHDEYRALTKAEILEKYENTHDSTAVYELYEYWELFKMLEKGGASNEERMAVYKHAYDDTERRFVKPWIYAANKYAISCMDAGIVDTTILSQFIDRTRVAGYKLQDMNGTSVTEINPHAVVANQLKMYLLANNFTSASVLAQMLPASDERFKELIAITMCLGGYYEGGDTPEERGERLGWYEAVKESTPINKVVMLLSQDTINHDKLAEEAILNLPEDNPLTWYFRAVVNSRKLVRNSGDYDALLAFEEALTKCFSMDSHYIDIARTDGDISERDLNEFLKYYNNGSGVSGM